MVRTLAWALTPFAMPILTGVWPRAMKRLAQTALMWGILALPLAIFGQDSGYGQLDRRVTRLEERQADLEKLIIRHDEFHQRVTNLLEQHENQIAGLQLKVTTNREAILQNASRDEMVYLGAMGLIGCVQLIIALFQAGIFRWPRRNGNGKNYPVS